MLAAGSCEAVFLDYGNVLGSLDVTLVVADLRTAGDDADEAAAAAALPAGYAAHDRVLTAGGDHAAGWRALLGRIVSAATHDRLPQVEVDRTVDALWARQPTRNLWRSVDGAALALLDDLAAADVPVVVVTNSEGRAEELLTELSIRQRVRGVVDSGVLGVSKPDPRIFHAAAAISGVPLVRTVHVGDSEAADVAGALGAGCLAIRFEGIVGSERETVAHARARSYAELRSLLARALATPL